MARRSLVPMRMRQIVPDRPVRWPRPGQGSAAVGGTYAARRTPWAETMAMFPAAMNASPGSARQAPRRGAHIEESGRPTASKSIPSHDFWRPGYLAPMRRSASSSAMPTAAGQFAPSGRHRAPCILPSRAVRSARTARDWAGPEALSCREWLASPSVRHSQAPWRATGESPFETRMEQGNAARPANSAATHRRRAGQGAKWR